MARRRWGLRIVGAIVGVLLVLILLAVGSFRIERHRVQRRLEHLLCETDYKALLDACRELSKRAAEGDLKRKVYVFRRDPLLNFLPFTRFHPTAEVASFPRAIFDVDPLFVQIGNDGAVWVALFWLPNQGVYAYPEGYQSDGHGLGDIELVPGLWFFDEDYLLDTRPKFVEYIDQLVEKGKRKNGVGDSVPKDAR